MIIRKAYKRACWEIDTLENNCDSHCRCFTAVLGVFLPSYTSESTPGMPARACRAAAGAGSSQQAEGEREGGVQESARGLGATVQRAGAWHRKAAARAQAESGEDGGDGEEAEGGAQRKTNNRGKMITFHFPLHDFLSFLCIRALTVRNNLRPNKIPPLFDAKFCKIYSLLWISFETNQNCFLSARRNRLLVSYCLKKKVLYWSQRRRAEAGSESWRRISKPWIRGQWKERLSSRGKVFSLFPLFNLLFCPFFPFLFAPRSIDGLTINAFC